MMEKINIILFLRKSCIKFSNYIWLVIFNISNISDVVPNVYAIISEKGWFLSPVISITRQAKKPAIKVKIKPT